jgi:phosphatidylserine/phosphatidylglycerophosphate/cardiolipin synthase-like enzyme
MKALWLCSLWVVSWGLTPSITRAKTLDTCFSPLGHCDQVLVSWINTSRKSLDGAIYGLTDKTIADALIRAHRRGVRVRVVHDKTQAAGKRAVSEVLAQSGIPVRIQRGSEGGILHHKFLIIDSSYVITGSFNWTRNASSKNDENFVVLDDQTPAFQKEFDRLWAVSTQRKPRPIKKRRAVPSHR